MLCSVVATRAASRESLPERILVFIGWLGMTVQTCAHTITSTLYIVILCKKSYKLLSETLLAASSPRLLRLSSGQQSKVIVVQHSASFTFNASISSLLHIHAVRHNEGEFSSGSLLVINALFSFQKMVFRAKSIWRDESGAKRKIEMCITFCTFCTFCSCSSFLVMPN